MSLQAVFTPVPTRSYNLAPAVAASSSNGLRFRRGSYVHLFADRPRACWMKDLNLRSYYLSSSTCFCHTNGTLQARNRPARLQAASLQAVTMDGDSSSSEAVGSSDHAWSGRDDIRPFLVSSLRGLQERLRYLQEGLRNVKERGLLESSRKGFEEAYSKLKTVDGKLVLEDVLQSKAVTGLVRTWQTSEPWIKWPLAIFVGVYLGVLATCGSVVAQDLIPLWMIGPLITGLIIRSAYLAADLTQKGVANSKPLRQAVMRGSVQLYEDAKKGELLDKLRILVELKSNELKEEVAKKRSNFVLYVKSREAATDLKVFLLLKFSSINDWTTEKYEDFVEWVRPYWRAFTRLMKKLF